MLFAETSMESDVEECRQAGRIMDASCLGEAANRLLGRAKRAMQVASKQVDSSDDPIYRNGLQVHINSLKQGRLLCKILKTKCSKLFVSKFPEEIL